MRQIADWVEEDPYVARESVVDIAALEASGERERERVRHLVGGSAAPAGAAKPGGTPPGKRKMGENKQTRRPKGLYQNPNVSCAPEDSHI